jgi:hypothetical protein
VPAAHCRGANGRVDTVRDAFHTALEGRSKTLMAIVHQRGLVSHALTVRLQAQEAEQ